MTELKYGRRNVAKMIREWDALRQAIRGEGTPAIQTALDQVEEHIDYAYRADLAAVPAQVRVKPLHEKANDLLTAARELAQFASYAEIVGGVSVNRNHVREWCDKVFDIIRGLPEDENFEPTLIAAIKPQPDPRDEVIAALVDALDDVMKGENWRMGQKFDANSGAFDLSVQRAALAAAKAVLK